MIIILAKELAETGPFNLNQVATLEKLASCSFHGSHLLLIETPSIANAILKAPSGTFGAVTQAVMKRLIAGFAFQGQFLSHSSEYIVIAPAITEATVSARVSKNFLSLEQAATMSFEPTTLLAEHVHDAEIYKHAAKQYLIAHRLKGVEIASISRGGGGSSITSEFENIADSNRAFCIAVTDSDRRSSEYGRSDTSKKCDAIASKNSPRTSHYCLPVREIENILPPYILRELVEGDTQHAVDKFERLVNTISEVRLFADIKDGSIGARIFKLSSNTEERKYLTAAVIAHGNNSPLCIAQEDCVAERNGSLCKCIAIPAIGAVASRFLAWLQSRGTHKALESFSGQWRECWLSIGAKAFMWCCAAPRFRG